MNPRRQRPPKGFTLVELGAVLAVTAILAAAILPDFIESARNRMAQKAAEDVATIHDAARWFYITSAKSINAVDRNRWPGQRTPVACENVVSPPNAHLTQLWETHNLESFPVNPWGRPYEAQLVDNFPATINGRAWGCAFEVATDVPEPVSQVFKTFLPQAVCNNEAPMPPCMPPSSPAPSNFVRCCARVPPPGAGMCAPPLVARTDPATPLDLRLKCLPPLTP